MGVGSAAKGATAWSTFSCGARWRRAGWSTSPPECPDMHLVEDRRVLHDRPTSAGVTAAAGSGGGVGVGAHKGSRFSSRLRGGTGERGRGPKGRNPPARGGWVRPPSVNARWFGRGGCGIVGTGRDPDGGACTRGQQVLGQGHRSDHDEQFRSPGARGLGRHHQERLSKLQSGLQGGGFRRWYPECGHRPAQLRGAGQRRGPGTRRGPGAPGEGEAHGGCSPVPVATEGGGEDRRACGVVTLPGPQVPCPVSDGPTASPDLVPTTPEERSAPLG